MCWKTDERERQVLPVIDPAATGRNIVRLRRQAGLSVRDMQALFGFTTPQAIYKWQNGEALPTLEHIAALSRALGVTIEEIIAFESREGA